MFTLEQLLVIENKDISISYVYEEKKDEIKKIKKLSRQN